MLITLKKNCLGVLDRGERGDDNETGLKEGGVIEIKTTVLFSLLDARSILLIYVPLICFCVTIGVM